MRLALALAAVAFPALAEPALVTGPDPGPDRPPVGRPLLDELFPDGLPFPFEAVLARLRAAAGEEHVATALIPLGRSLQRYAASPDYFASPRIVVAVTGDTAAGPAAPRLADRLFLGYQPAAEVIEAISYNPAAGRFEFQEIVGYTAEGAAPAPAERAVCVACHQGQGPIFPRPLWTETNANPAVAARLAPLGPSFHGAPVSQTVDALDALDAATDRAARIALANRLWAEACPDASCRAALLIAAIRVGLTGTADLREFDASRLRRCRPALAGRPRHHLARPAEPRPAPRRRQRQPRSHRPPRPRDPAPGRSRSGAPAPAASPPPPKRSPPSSPPATSPGSTRACGASRRTNARSPSPAPSRPPPAPRASPRPASTARTTAPSSKASSAPTAHGRARARPPLPAAPDRPPPRPRRPPDRPHRPRPAHRRPELRRRPGAAHPRRRPRHPRGPARHPQHRRLAGPRPRPVPARRRPRADRNAHRSDRWLTTPRASATASPAASSG